ncbi:MAG: DUF2804 domain-containing protein [Candidatus Lokiarchaeota archaeon]|nr:DUF2804 domain-containing protein [Candidatus Lokiarchaeota archaeon]
MQKEITKSHDLLDNNGHLIETGKAKQLILKYDRSKVKASKLRIKEWDYYEILNENYGIILLYHDVGYLGVAQVTWMDFNTGNFEELQEQVWFSKGSMDLPADNEGDIIFDRNGNHWECLRRGEDRIFKFNYPKFRKGVGISGEIKLREPTEMDSIVNVIPFKKENQFVYALKTNNMIPDGKVKIGNQEFEFSEENRSNGLLDWTRAVFPYHVEWRWSSFNGKVDGTPFGLNIDYGITGFGTESSKDMIFYNYKGHYIDKVHYTWDKKDPYKDWEFKSVNEDRVSGTLKVKYVHKGGMNFIVLKTQVLKAYGFFIGKVKLDDGTIIDVKEQDHVFGHAEAVINYW